MDSIKNYSNNFFQFFLAISNKPKTNQEKQFINFYLKQNEHKTIVSAFAGAVFFAALPWLCSIYFFSNLHAVAVILTWGIISPLFLGLCVSFWVPRLKNRRYQLVLFSVLTAGLGTIVIGELIQAQGVRFPHEVLILYVIYTYIFSGLLFAQAALSSLIFTFLYLILEVFQLGITSEISSQVIFLLFANAAGTLACIHYENTMRRNFIKQRKLEDLAQKDVLTGIYNRRYFEDNYQRICRQAFRENKYLTVMLIDVDYFKNYNDRYGHIKGDKALQKVAQSLNSIVKRPLDIVARYGGEEFVVVCYNSRKNFAQSLAEQILEQVESLNIPHCKSNASNYLTLSIGGAVAIPETKAGYHKLLGTADIALYEAKRSGRNQAIIWEAEDFKTLSDQDLQASANQWAQRKSNKESHIIENAS